MFSKRVLSIVLVASVMLLAVGIAPGVANSARALLPVQPVVTIPYSGSLTSEVGQPVADGAYDFTFALYAAESGGEPAWTEAQDGVAVQGGAFTVLLGSVAPLPKGALDGGVRWLEVEVRGPGEAEYTALSPRQELSQQAASVDPTAPTASSCAHTHLVENWVGNNATYALRVLNNGTGDGFRGISYSTAPDFAGVVGASYGAGGSGVYGLSTSSGRGVYGQSTTGDGVDGTTGATGMSGVYGHAANSFGVTGRSTNSFGVQAVGGGDASTTDAVGDLLLGGQYGEIFSTGAGGMDLLSNYDIRMHLDKDNNSSNEWFRIFNGAGADIFHVDQVGNMVAAGSKVGYVVDVAQNDDTVSLETGDVVVISGAGEAVVGEVPVVKVRLASVEGTSAVIGVVDKCFVSAPAHDAALDSSASGSSCDDNAIAPGEYLTVVTLGSFKAIKVDASYGAIAPGDLLVASPNPGYAMRATSPAPGTIIGKALGALESGTGVIPIIVTLQ